MRMSIDGSLCAYDSKSNTYYYPLSENINNGDKCNFNITYGIMGEKIYINDTIIESKTKIPVVFNQPYTVIVETESTTLNCNLVFTRLPIVMLMPTRSILGNTNGIVIVTDPNDLQNKQKSSQISSDMYVAIRGNTCARFDKKSYKLKLVDGSGAEINYPLVGLRNDGDWILDAIYNDFSKTRKKVSMYLWLDMSTVYYDNNIQNGINSRYVEVFLNDNYQGLYMLRERIDKKQLQLADNGGILYKCFDWGSPGNRLASFIDKPTPPKSSNIDMWGNLETIYPSPYCVNNDYWSPFYSLAELVVLADDARFIEEIGSMIDYDNIAEYFLFVNLIKGYDNMGKNIYWSIADINDLKRNKLIITAWDLDATFGSNWKNIEIDSSSILYNKLFERLITLNPDNFVELVKTKWNVLRKDIITSRNIKEKYETEYDMLKTSGALDREADRWNEYLMNTHDVDIDFHVADVGAEIDYILKWSNERIKYLDEQIPLLSEKNIK